MCVYVCVRVLRARENTHTHTHTHTHRYDSGSERQSETTNLTRQYYREADQTHELDETALHYWTKNGQEKNRQEKWTRKKKGVEFVQQGNHELSRGGHGLNRGGRKGKRGGGGGGGGGGKEEED